MKKQENAQPEEALKQEPAEQTKNKKPGRIKARVIDEDNGIQILNNVRAVRIVSKGYVLLVLEDYTPTLGEIDGDVTFLCDDREVVLDRIRGFYKMQHNEFTLLIAEDQDGWYEKI